MKTVFRKGMKVYDQFNSPDMEGVVVEVIDNECDDYPIGVSFLKYDICYYTPEGRFNKSDIPTLSTKPYEVEFKGFEQKAPAPTYEEAIEWCIKNLEDYRESVCTEYVNEKQDNAFEALRKLVILRDYYNEGWQPDWTKATVKYCIEVYGEDLSIIDFQFKLKPMAFKTREIRDKFLEEQRELLEIAKPLL